MRSLLLAATAAVVCAANSAEAQSTVSPTTAEEGLTATFYEAQSLQVPLDRSASPLSGIEIVTGQDTSIAAIRGNLEISDGERFSAFAFTLSSPLDKSGAGFTSLANLDGLGNSTSFEIGYNEMRGRRLETPVEEIGRLCDVARVNAGLQATQDGCGYEEILRYAPGQYGAYLQATQGFEHVWVWGASARVGFQEFTYYDGATLARLQNDETLWRASAYVGYLFRSSAMATATLTSQTAFKDRRTQVLCPGGAPPVTCVNGPIGAPEEIESLLLGLDYRRQIFLGAGADRFLSGPDLGYSFAATYDFETEVYGFDLPIYLLRDSSDLLTGGVRLGWRSDDHELTVGLIVSRPFSFSN